jgi:type I restriction enzyme S subunit
MNRDWKQMKLVDIIQKTETINPQKTPNASFEYIDISSICNKRFVIQETSTIFGKDAPSRARKLIRTGDVLFATVRPTLKRIAQVPKHLDCQVCSTGYFVFRPKDFVEAKFLFYFLFTEHFMGAMEQLQKGASYPAVNDGEVSNQTILIPPLPEQKQIVAILDEAFEGIDRAIANTEKNLANSRELFESYLNAIFTEKNKDWVQKKLSSLSEVKSGGTPLISKPEYWGGQIAWYSSGELNNLYTNAPERTITDKGLENSNAKLFPKGSLLIGMYDTAALKMSILNREAAFNQAIAGVTPNNKIDLIFILHAINFVKPQILSLRRGVRQKNLSLQKIKDIVIAVPELQEQQKIVRQLALIREETRRLETIYRQKLAALKELKQSILQKAFTGELTADTSKTVKEELAA